jgi:uncharacterized repeat protein (TIGR03837 family)
MAAPHPTSAPSRTLRWDLFCRVIDNFGDIGVCWRLARALAARGDAVRLVADDTSALAWMAPQGAPGVEVRAWDDAPTAPGDAVVEAFGCDPPGGFDEAMLRAAGRGRAPVWINLEYLSAEPYVERSHGLRSPQPSGLDKWFFYPGFTARTGGLIREGPMPGAAERAQARQWLHDRGWVGDPQHRVVSLFCYDNPALPELLATLGSMPTTLLVTPGHAARQIEALIGQGWRPPPDLTLAALPWLGQPEYDCLLAGCDLNLVRGEDSLVRAVWAGRPFLWQIYPQHDGAHRAKLEAFLALQAWPAEVLAAWRAWNGFGAPAGLRSALAKALAAPAAWREAADALRERLAAGPELATSLRDFVLARLAARDSGKP